eukprot:6866906-Prymnesium_polylepis.2
MSGKSRKQALIGRTRDERQLIVSLRSRVRASRLPLLFVHLPKRGRHGAPWFAAQHRSAPKISARELVRLAEGFRNDGCGSNHVREQQRNLSHAIARRARGNLHLVGHDDNAAQREKEDLVSNLALLDAKVARREND